MRLPLLLVLASAAVTSVSATDRPIIGILAQETTPDIDALFPELNYTSYVQASYVQFVESAGARAAPVFVYRSQQYYEDMFRQLNGLLLPGGDSQLDSDGFGAAARAFWELAHAHPEVHFPIWGTCQGHQELAFLAGGTEVIGACDAQNQVVAVQPTSELDQSRLFANATDEELALFTVEPNVVMFHSNCVMPDSFSRLATEFRSLATNDDRQGAPYVSILEHLTLPIYGVQFHPEKAAYEWSTLARVSQFPHWPDAVAASQYLANFLAAEARRSQAAFATETAEQAALIYNYPAHFTGARGSTFQMCYFFDDSEYM